VLLPGLFPWLLLLVNKSLLLLAPK
jgi:hypothetical protein